MKKTLNAFRFILIAATVLFSYIYGFQPLQANQRKAAGSGRKYWSEQLAQANGADYDVIVYGGEPQGLSAAISAARLGAKTLLISEGADAGGIITNCLIPELEKPLGQKNKLLNGGILEEMDDKLGNGFSKEKYLTVINELLDGEDTLDVRYNTSIAGVSMSGVYLDRLELRTEKGKETLSGKIYIDASNSGNLLDACKVPYFTGSGDLNMEDSFMPVSLNFEMISMNGAIDSVDKINELLNGDEFHNKVRNYQVMSKNAVLENPFAYLTGDSTIVMSGLQLTGIDVSDQDKLKDAYSSAIDEAKNFLAFLSANFQEFGSYSFSRAAERLRVHEHKHYKGNYLLTVQDIMNNRFFDETVAMGSHPVLIGKFAARGSFVAGNPVQYGVPLRCLVPEKMANLLMAGPQISYSSLAASSAGTIGTSIATGEAAGALAVFCAARNENPGFVDKNHEQYSDFKQMLKDKGMYLPNSRISSKHSKYKDNWSYPSAAKLISLGLVAGGADNNLKYDEKAKQMDLAFILINGIYRLDESIYTKELYDRLRPFINNEDLTYDAAVAVMGALYDIEGSTQEVYTGLCERNCINDIMQKRLEDKEELTMDEVYYLGAYSLQHYTGKRIGN
ncbi:MAG: FAD-dependent oxidoreductase [Clostridiaceae bacterium]|nr:FAD-dependent oxidoreductase [Clostridiaceae bacterium]